MTAVDLRDRAIGERALAKLAEHFPYTAGTSFSRTQRWVHEWR